MPYGNQIVTKNGKPIINSETKLPIYGRTVKYRIKMIKEEINKGLNKTDSVWNNIINDTKLKFAC